MNLPSYLSHLCEYSEEEEGSKGGADLSYCSQQQKVTENAFVICGRVEDEHVFRA